MRKTIEEIKTNLAYHWFLEFGFHAFGKIMSVVSTYLEQIFFQILKQAADKKLLSPEHVFIDSTHVKASANKRKFEKKVVRKETKIDLFILYTIINNQWNGAEATRLLREVEERLRPRRRSRGGSASSPRKASGCSAIERTCSSNVTHS